MKKFTAIVMAALLITVSGVYATWNYANGTAPSDEEYLDAIVTLADAIDTGAKGTIDLQDDSASTLRILIDDDNNDFNGEISATGAITGTFVAAPGADEGIIDGSTPPTLQYTISFRNPTWVHEHDVGENFTIAKINNAGPHTLALTDLGNGQYSFTITAEELFGTVQGSDLAPTGGKIDFYSPHLPDKNHYDGYKDALHANWIILTVSDATPAPVSP